MEEAESRIAHVFLLEFSLAFIVSDSFFLKEIRHVFAMLAVALEMALLAAQMAFDVAVINFRMLTFLFLVFVELLSLVFA